MANYTEKIGFIFVYRDNISYCTVKTPELLLTLFCGIYELS